MLGTATPGSFLSPLSTQCCTVAAILVSAGCLVKGAVQAAKGSPHNVAMRDAVVTQSRAVIETVLLVSGHPTSVELSALVSCQIDSFVFLWSVASLDPVRGVCPAARTSLKDSVTLLFLQSPLLPSSLAHTVAPVVGCAQMCFIMGGGRRLSWRPC